MNPERFSAVRALWEAALEKPLEARSAFVMASAPNDPALRAEVLELLDVHDDTSDLMSGAFPKQLWLDSASPGGSLVGKTVGAYRVTREIGHGGMGTVYEAERADEQFTKRVAIKTLRSDRGGDAVLERFARERQIQAALTHPNIATLLDAGVTGDRIPFIVLEYIDGVPIDEYCSNHKLPLNERLDLFRQVIKAVQHAHRQLVVHRDLKPSNILVTAGGIVKLLDFGISKLLDESPDHTQTAGPRAFTTAYASPEQIRGEPVSTATDVYSLGVVLYRLLSGASPFDIENTTSAAAWTIICEQDPTLPSSAATNAAAAEMGLGSSARLNGELKGELDAIVLMALRKEPDRRYATADALGEDLLNYLRGLPVQARPDSPGYRVRKLVSRNRLATAALVAAFVAMGGGTTVALQQARAARRSSVAAESQRQIAVQERRTAERVSAFLQQVFSAADRSWAGASFGPDATIAEVIDTAADRVDTDFAGEPAVAEALHRILESTYTALRQTDKGLKHSLRVLELMRARGASDAEMARGLHDLSAMLFVGGQRDSSLATIRQSYALFEAAGSPETEDFSVTLNQLGLALWEMGRPAEAEPFIVRSLAVRRKVVGDDVVAALISSNAGLIREAQGDLAGAERHYRQAEEIYAKLTDREYFEHGFNLNNLATLLLLKGDFVEAERVMQRSIALLAQVLGPENVMVGRARINLARIELAQGRPTDALATYRAGRRLLAHLPPDHADVAGAETHEASILLALGRTAEAEVRAQHSLTIRAKVFATGDWRIAEAEGVLGRIQVARGATAEGRKLLISSRDGLLRALGATHPRTIAAEHALVQ